MNITFNECSSIDEEAYKELIKRENQIFIDTNFKPTKL
jgi:hypothetical protein